MLQSLPRGKLFVVSAPSGVGKTTIIRSVLGDCPWLRYSVSSTTRLPRQGEIPGEDYHFLTRQEFVDGIRSGRFLEWAEVHGQYYGTDGEQLARWLTAGDDVLLDIDVQGARQVRSTYPDVRTIFILPPSLDVLAARLANRGTESAEQMERRLSAARREIQEGVWYDYAIVNDVLEEAIADFKAILRACSCERALQGHRFRTYLLPQDPS
jgi:guanylate kinase